LVHASLPQSDGLVCDPAPLDDAQQVAARRRDTSALALYNEGLDILRCEAFISLSQVDLIRS
jgi:hypothetical protein